MRTMNFDAIGASAPLNRTASVVRDSLATDHWAARIPSDIQHWTAPPLPLRLPNANTPDLVGRRLGRLTVIRFHGYSGRTTPRPVWLCRCACGDYEVRRTKTIIADANPDACCFICQTVENLRKQGSSKPTKASRRADAAFLDQLAGGGRV